MNLLFDIDGTLTEPVQPIQPPLRQKLDSLIQHHNVYLVAGSTYAKVESQLGEWMHSLKGTFTSSGAEYHVGSKLVYSLPKPDLDFYPDLKALIHKYLDLWQQTQPQNAQTQIEVRPGMLNLCPVGREAPKEQRQTFIDHDAHSNFRKSLVDEINALALNGVAPVIGGQVSVDLYFDYFSGKDHAVNYLTQFGLKDFMYFGDKMTPQGNDYPAAVYILHHGLGAAVSVESPEDTLRFLDAWFPE